MTLISPPTVLITGAAKRVGREIALFMARQGWNVAVHYGRSETEAHALVDAIRAMGRNAAAVHADLANSASLERLIPAVIETVGPLHCLINNASAFERDTLGTLNDATWRANMDANLRAPLLLIRDFAAQYRAAKEHTRGAQIINLVDGNIGWSLSSHFLSYSLSKLGLANATELLARELAPDIRINAIALGATLPGAMDKADTFDKLREAAPLRRVSHIDEVCGTIDYLLATPSITGQTIHLSGGLHLPPKLAGV